MKFFTLTFILIFASWFLSPTFSQATMQFLGAAGSGGPSGSGPSTANQTTTFYINATTAFSPAITATYSLSNQQFTSVEGNATTPGTVFGATLSNTVNTPVPASPLYPLMNSLSAGQVAANYTACYTCTAGTGVNNTTTNSILIMNISDALVNAAGTQLWPINATVQYSDLTITFSRPVSNPILQITGLGGQVSYNTVIGAVTTYYDLGFSTDLTLLTPGLTLSKLSGNAALSVSGSNITNNATRLGAPTAPTAVNGVIRSAATGSVAIVGTNISSVSFRLFLRGDGGVIVDPSGNPLTATNGNIVRWALHGGFIPGGGTAALNGVSGDGFLMGISLAQPVTVSGNVLKDPNGGNVDNSTGATNAVPAGMFANLIDNNGKVVASVTVATNGTYSFPAIFEGTYKVAIGTVAGTVGATAPSVALPTGYANTGAFNGAPGTGNSGTTGTSQNFTVSTANVTNINFGVQQLPIADNKTQTIPQPTGNAISAGTATNAISGTDPDGGAGGTSLTYSNATTMTIKQLPTNGTILYNGTPLALNQNITGFNPALLSYSGISIGSTSIAFNYAFTDAAGATSNSASYQVNWLVALPVKLIDFQAYKNNNQVFLTWNVSREIDVKSYSLERSSDGVYFNEIDKLAARSLNSYFITDTKPAKGTNYYRLLISDIDGKTSYSHAIRVNFNNKGSDCSLYPNPAKDIVTIVPNSPSINNTALIEVYTFEGNLVSKQRLNGSVYKLNTALLPTGKYIVAITKNTETIRLKMTVIH